MAGDPAGRHGAQTAGMAKENRRRLRDQGLVLRQLEEKLGAI
jgi:hypothetical protein